MIDIPMPKSLEQLLSQMSPEGAGNVMAVSAVRQALYELLGGYPAGNIVPYSYAFELSSATNDGAVAANTLKTASIKVSSDAIFVAKTVTGASDGPYKIQARLDSSDRQIMNRAVRSETWVGTAERPFVLPQALLLKQNTTISFDVTDLSGAENAVYLNLNGFKIFAAE